MFDEPVLVTGAAGFVGRHLLAAVAGTGVAAEAWTRGAAPAGAAHPRVTWRDVDVLDRQAVAEAFGRLRPAVVFHCAGATHVGRSLERSAESLRTNVLGTHHLLEADRLCGGSSRLLVPGSATVYAPSPEPLTEDAPLHPDSPYAVSKLAQEQLARQAAAGGQRVFITRSFNHIGRWQSASFAASSFARQVSRIERGLIEPVLRVGNLAPKRDLTDVRDTIRAYFAIVEHGRPGVVYNVCSGRGLSMQQVVDGLLARAAVRIEIAVDPSLLRPHDAPVLVGSFDRLRSDTGWQPAIALDETLDDLLAYWRAETASGVTPAAAPPRS